MLDSGLVIESREFAGVRIITQPAPYADLFAVAGLTEEQEKAVEQFLRAQVGKPYDYTMVARFISRRKASHGQAGKWFCSELVFAAFRQAGVELLSRVEPWAVSPGLLAMSPRLVLDKS